jgi:hypothetical protein
MQPWVHKGRQLGIKPIQYACAVAHPPAERVGADATLSIQCGVEMPPAVERALFTIRTIDDL